MHVEDHIAVVRWQIPPETLTAKEQYVFHANKELRAAELHHRNFLAVESSWINVNRRDYHMKRAEIFAQLAIASKE